MIQNSESDPVRFEVQRPENNFVGRLDELSRLKESLKLTTLKPPIIVVAGLGGIGKTQLVRQFIMVNRVTYNNVIWVNAESPESINESFDRLVKYICVTSYDNGSKKEMKQVVQQALSKLSKPKTLFIYDNVQRIEHIRFVLEMETFDEIRPHVIITSRIQEWPEEMNVIQLKVLKVDDAIQYVRQTFNDVKYSDNENKLLVGKLQCLPLALRQATAYIKHQLKSRDLKMAKYLHEYDTPKMLDSTIFQTSAFACNYKNTTFTTWNITIQAIRKESVIGPLAVRILHIIAYFDSENIHRDMFIHHFCQPGEISESKEDYQERVMSAVSLLVNYSMVDSYERQSVLNIHRLVQIVIKLKLQQTGEDKDILRHALMLISNIEESVRLHACHSHAISVFLSALKFNDLVRDFKTLPPKVLSSLIESKKYNLARTFGDKALQRLIDILGKDDEDMLDARLFIGVACICQGKQADALEIIKSSFEKIQNVLGADHPNTLQSKYYIAFSFSEQGKCDQALEIYKEVFDKQKIKLGEYHPDTLETQRKIASVYRKLQSHSVALQIYQEVFDKQKEILGEDHPDTLETRSSIAYSFIEQGNHAEALQIYEDIFNRQTINLGSNHPDTLQSKSLIACSRSHQQEFSVALQMYQEIFDKQKETLGENHPHTMKTKFDIALCNTEQGLHNDALQIFEQVFEKQKNNLGVDHFHTLKTRFHIAMSYTELGRHSDALRIYQSLFKKQRNNLGEDHQLTLNIKFHIGLCNTELGKHTDALQIFSEVFEKQKNILGENHPDTLKTRFNIAFCYTNQGMRIKALQVFKEVFEKQKIVLGEDHPYTAICKAFIKNSNNAKKSRIVIR